MSRFIAAWVLIALCGAAVGQDRQSSPERGSVSSQGSSFSGGRTFGGPASRASRPAAANAPLKAGPLLRLEVLIAELDQAMADDNVTADAVLHLAKDRKLASQMRINLLALAN